MANAKRCDRCQTFYNGPAMNEEVMIDGLYTSRIKFGLHDDNMEEKDFCPNCAKSFVN